MLSFLFSSSWRTFHFSFLVLKENFDIILNFWTCDWVSFSTEECFIFQIAAFIAEPVMGAGGVIPPPATYFDKVSVLMFLVVGIYFLAIKSG